VTLSFAGSDGEAREIALDQWRQSAVGPDKLADLATPAEFDDESARVTAADIEQSVRISSDVERHLDWLHEDFAMGFERLYVHNVARQHLDRFIDIWAQRVLPAVA
jgi:hypothetical protein